MTRRLAITILLTVWATIVVAGVAAWLTARTVLLRDLDSSIARRAMLVNPDVRSVQDAGFGSDRYVIVGSREQTLARSHPSAASVPPTQVIDAAFVRLPEGTYRRLTLQMPATDSRGPLTIVYSASAADFARVLQRLTISLALCGGIAGAACALIAVRLARLALRPLRQTAELVGGIDPSSLDQRVQHERLPPELRLMGERLNQMLQRLQTAFEQRRRFLADASHELRTPVAAIITTIEVALRRSHSADELEQTLRICLDEARHMRQLVQALMAQVRGEHATPAAQLQTIDAGRLLYDCTQAARALADQRNVRLVSHVPGTIPIQADPAQLRSAILNLVSNAIEYNRAGGEVAVSAHLENGTAEICVKDDGPGIPPEHLDNLFQPFYRASSADGAADGHLGLGLFLVNSYIKAMGGNCKLDSVPGQGTTVRICLPRVSDVSVGKLPCESC